MATKTSYPGTLQQTIGGNYATWDNLNQIKTTASGYATSTVGGASAPLEHQPNTASKIFATNFRLDIPENSKITKIEVVYRHYLYATMSSPPQIPAPKIKLLNLGNDPIQTGVTPTTTSTEDTVTFNISPDIVNVNNTNFGLEFRYPTNLNEMTGQIRLKYVYVVVTYTPATYTIKANNTSTRYDETVYKDDIVPITLTVKDDNSVGYDPTIEITLVDNMGFLFLLADGDGTMTISPIGSGAKLYWKIPFSTLSSTTATATIYIKTMIQTARIWVSYPLNNTDWVDCYITPTNDPNDSIGESTLPSTSIIETPTPEHTETIYMAVSDTFTFDISNLDEDRVGDDFQIVVDTKAFKYRQGTTSYTTVGADKTNERYIDSGDLINNVDFQFPSTGKRTIYIKSDFSDVIYYKYIVNVAPDTLGSISASVLTVPSETLARMGDGYVYTAQAPRSISVLFFKGGVAIESKFHFVIFLVSNILC